MAFIHKMNCAHDIILLAILQHMQYIVFDFVIEGRISLFVIYYIYSIYCIFLWYFQYLTNS